MNPYKTIILTCARLAGAAVAIIIIILVLAYSPFFRNPCKDAYGRICNGFPCNQDGSCACGDLYSGVACEFVGMAGYLSETNQVCRGHAKEPPNFKKSRLPEICQEEKATIGNGQVYNDKGFHRPECQAILQKNRQDIYDGIATPQQVRETPSCVCGVHFKGTECQEEGCPMTDSGLVCGGNGNTSVGFLKNGTNIGVGCQCGNVVYPGDFLPLLSKETSQILYESGDLDFYANGICGEVYQDELYPDIVMILQTKKSAYRCFCKERAKGEICLQNVCAVFGGLVCAGKGFKGSGFGYERNTTRNVTIFGDSCDPICVAGSTLCNGGCTLSKDRYCRRKTPLKCPKETPYRCPDMSCVSGTQTSTQRELHYGYLETPPPPTCNLLLRNSTNEQRTACIGSSGVFFDQNKFEPRGDVTFTSSLRTFQFQMMPQENGVLNLFYNNERIRTVMTSSTEIVTVYQVLELDRDIYESFLYQDVQSGCYLTTSNRQRFEVRPSPFRPLANNEPLSQQQVRFRNDFIPNEYFVAVTQNVRVEFSIPPTLSAWDIVVNISDTLVLLPDRRLVTYEQCFNNIESCVWRSDTFLSLSGKRKICLDTDGTVISSVRLSCDTSDLPPFLPVSYVLEVISKAPMTTNLEFTWTLQNNTFSGRPTSKFTWENINNVVVSNIQFVTIEDMRKPAICIPDPIEYNASIWNRQWENELIRPAPTREGDYAIGRRPTIFGDHILARGIYRGDGLLYVEHENKAYNAIGLKHLNNIEYQKGVYECEESVWETRCPDAQCAQLQASVVNDMVHQCSCKNFYPFSTSCICVDENNVTNSCVCSVSDCKCTMQDKQIEFDLFDSIDEFLRTSYCLYFPTENAVSPLITTIGNTTSVTLDRTILLWFEYSSCLVYNTSIPIDFTCESNNSSGKARIKYNYQLGGIPSQFVITGNGTITQVFTTFKNAAPLYAESVSVSSNPQDAENVIWNNDTVWQAVSTDHDAFVQFSYSNVKHFTMLLVEFSRLGFMTDTYFLPVRAIIQVSNTSTDDSWLDLAKITGKTANGSQVEQVELDAWAKYIRVYGKAPIGVRVFLPFSDQDCFNNGTSVNNIQLFVSTEQDLSAATVAAVLAKGVPGDNCVCTDTCTLEGFNAAKNGICQDSIYKQWNPNYVKELGTLQALTPDVVLRRFYNLSTTFPLDATLTSNLTNAFWLGNITRYNLSVSLLDLTSFFSGFFIRDTTLVNLTGDTSQDIASVSGSFLILQQEIYSIEQIRIGEHYCYPGQDCSDCGHSDRQQQIDIGGSCEQNDQTKFIFTVLGNTSLDTNHLFILQDLIAPLSYARFDLNITQKNKVVFTPKCLGVQPVVTCTDGSGALTTQRCTEPRFNCPGDGCTIIPDQPYERVCACEPGQGGRDCSYDVCSPATPITLKEKTKFVDPAKWCTCQRQHGGRLVIRPPFSYDSRYTILTKEQLITINQREPLKNDWELVYNNLGWDDGPGGGRAVTYIETAGAGNQSFVTNCKPVVKDRRGIYRTLEKCQDWSEDYPKRPIGWKVLYEFNGQPYTIPWSNIFAYNDLPYPCSQGSCVESQSHCFQEEINRPICNNNGICHVDGYCECEKGKETFVINDDISKRAKYPYYVENPTIWGNQNHREYSDMVCKARDCNVVDCTRRKACFPGSILNNFNDRLFTCPDTTSFGGMCAPDLTSCKEGKDLSEPIDCGGNGYLIREENRPWSYRCICGLPPFQLQVGAVIKNSADLIPNGFGGPLCTDHLCTENQDILYYERIDPTTGTHYVDENGDALPGVWYGPCRTRAGFRIDDINDVNSCCPENGRIEHCQSVICVINGLEKCVDISECQGAARKPKIYVCNGHGDALADGTCLCQYDELTSTGYTADHNHYSFEGCFQTIRCPFSKVTETPCGRLEANKGMSRWVRRPYMQYSEQQYKAFLAKEGLPPTDKYALKKTYPNPYRRDKEILNAAIARAQYGLGEIAAVQSCVAVGPNDTTTSYCCMINNKVPPPVYGEGFNLPYLLDNLTLSDERTRFLFDTYRFVNTYQFRYQAGHLRMVLQATFNTGKKFIDVIRIRATYNQSTPSSAKFKFTLEDGSTYFSDLIPSSANIYRWIEVKLLEKWQDVDLTTFNQWIIKCKPDPSTALCLAWFDPTCETQGGLVNVPGSFVLRSGCSSRCCKLIQTAPQLSSFIQIEVDPFTVGVDVSLFVQGISLWGHGTTRVQPIPENFANELQFRTGISTCLDELYANHRDTKLCGQGSYFVGRNFPAATVVQNLNFEQAKAQCASSGAALATTLGGEQLSDYARTAGAACYGDRAASASVCDTLPITGVDNGCLVGAMEVTTPIQPTADYFIQPSCLVNGCYVIAEGIAVENGLAPIVAYAPSEDGGTSWKTPSPTLPNQAAWNLVFSEWFYKERRRATYQANYYTIGACFVSTYVQSFQTLNYQQCSKIFSASTGCLEQDTDDAPNPTPPIDFIRLFYSHRVIAGADRDGLVTQSITSGEQTTYTSIQQGTAATIPNKFTHETGNFVCQIIVWDQAMCGVYTYGTYLNPYYNGPGNPVTDRSVAAKRTFLVQPGTYQEFLHKDLSGYLFDACEDGTTNCNNYNKTIKSHGFSFSLNGPCDIFVSDIYGGTFSATTNYPDSSGKRQPRSWTHFKTPWYEYQIGGRCTSPTGNFPDGRPRTYWYGNCFSNFQVVDLPGSFFDPYPGKAYSLGCDPNQSNSFSCNIRTYAGHTWNDDKLFEQINFLLIKPRFTSRRIEVSIFTETKPHGDPTGDEYTMGHQTHQYMCVTPQVLQTYKVTPAGIDDAVILLVNKRVTGPVVIGNLNNLFFTEDGNGNLVSPFVPCPRLVRPCFNDCFKTRPPSTFQFRPGVYQQPDFVEEVSIMRQVDLGASPVVVPDLFANWQRAGTGQIIKFHKLLDMNNATYFRAGARLISKLKTSEYPTKYFLDLCVRVIKNAFGSGVPYRFDTALCDQNAFAAMCMRDTIKYTAQSGTLLDLCGASCRTKSYDPGATPFTLHPDGIRANKPELHRLIDAYLDGSISSIFLTTEIDPKEIMKEVMSKAKARGLALSPLYPIANKYWNEQISQRPGHVSRGQVEDPEYGIDMEYSRWVPLSCKRVFSLDTLIGTVRASSATEFCKYETQLKAGAYKGALPGFMNGISPLRDRTREPACGTWVDPTVFDTYYEESPPWIDSSRVRVREKNGRRITLEMLAVNATWRNTGQRQDYIYEPQREFIVTGDINCVGCTVQLWISSFSATASAPAIKLAIGSITGTGYYSFTVTHNITSQIMMILGWDISGTTLGDLVELSPALVTNNQSRYDCTLPIEHDEWVDIDTTYDSAAFDHQCITSIQQAKQLNADKVGICHCEISQPFLGATCDEPATFSLNGKNVCNKQGDNEGNAFDMDGNIVPLVLHDGLILEKDNTYRCAKCKNTGMMLQTTLQGEQPNDFRKVTIGYTPAFESRYILVNVPEVQYPQLVFDYTREGLQVCQSFSYSLVSFGTLEEIIELKERAFFPFQTDLQYKGEGVFVFGERGLPLRDRANSSDIVLPRTNPCNGWETLCNQLHFNDLLYNYTASSSLVNGGNDTVCLSSSTLYTFGFNAKTVQFPITIEIWQDSGIDLSTFIVITYSDVGSYPCGSYSSLTQDKATWTCTGTSGGIHPTTIRLTTGVVGPCLRGITAFNGYDMSRVPGLYEY